MEVLQTAFAVACDSPHPNIFIYLIVRNYLEHCSFHTIRLAAQCQPGATTGDIEIIILIINKFLFDRNLA